MNRKADFFAKRIDSNRFEARIGMLYHADGETVLGAYTKKSEVILAASRTALAAL